MSERVATESGRPRETASPPRGGDGGGAPAPEAAGAGRREERAAEPIYVDFLVFRVGGSFWRLTPDERREAAREFAPFLEKPRDGLAMTCYLCQGIRADADFILWFITPEVERVSLWTGEMRRTRLGAHLEIAHSFLALRKGSQYTPFHPPAFELGVPRRRYLFLYPFVKTREWYLLPFERRRAMMEEHMKVGRRFPMVELNTTYSFGLGDQEFVLAFEADSPADFEELVQQLRETEASRYVVRDTPMIVGVARRPADLVRDLGL